MIQYHFEVYLCQSCGLHKLPADFYASTGHTCKACVRARSRANRLGRLEVAKAYDNTRANQPHRVAARLAYARTERGRAARVRANRAYSEREPFKAVARYAVSNAIRDSRLKRPAVCSQCEATGPVQGHHEDYTKPLAVVWLCPPCHYEVHRNAQPF